jgi:uncharacterized protein (TIGR03000 family)
VPGTPEKKPDELPNPKKGSTSLQQSVRARLTVEVPAGAKLYVDGQPVKATSARRDFVTPPLQRGRAYYYELRAEVVRDGQTVGVNRRVIIRAGEEARAAFPELQGTPTTSVQQVDPR